MKFQDCEWLENRVKRRSVDDQERGVIRDDKTVITCWTFTAGVAERIIVENVVEVTKSETGTFVVIVRWHVLREIILILIILMAGMSCRKQN